MRKRTKYTNKKENILSVLADIKEDSFKEYKKQLEKWKKKAKEYNEAKDTRDLLKEYKEEQMIEAGGAVHGMHQIIEIIDQHIEIQRKKGKKTVHK